MKSLLTIAALALLLSGCALGPDFSATEIKDMAVAESNAREECYEWITAVAEDESKKVSTMTKDQAYMYLLTRSYQQSTEKIVASFTGRSVDPCGGGMNVWGYLAEKVKQQGETNREMIRGVVKVGTMGVITWGATDIADGMFGAFKDAGSININNSANARLSGVANKSSAGDHGSASAGDHTETSLNVHGTAGTSGSLDQSQSNPVTSDDDVTTTVTRTDTRTNTETETNN